MWIANVKTVFITVLLKDQSNMFLGEDSSFSKILFEYFPCLYGVFLSRNLQRQHRQL